MAGIYNYSATAASNTTVGGANVAEGTAPSNINDALRGLAADAREFADDLGAQNNTGGSATAYTLTTDSGISALADGRLVGGTAHAANTGTATLNVDGLGAKAIRKHGDRALSPDDIESGQKCLWSYDASSNGGSGAWLLLNPSSPARVIAWARCSGGTGTVSITASAGVTSVTRDSTGIYDVVLSSTRASANDYAVSAMANAETRMWRALSHTTTGFQLRAFDQAGGADDASTFSFMVVGS
jgi:hypothetical protein